jgi:S1-C subfamily serine protease
VPINTVTRELSDLQAGRQVRHAWLGIAGADITESMAEQCRLPVKQGILLTRVTANGPAARAGLRAGSGADCQTIATGGDIITAIDGRQVKSVEDIAAYLATKLPGDKVKLDIVREGRNTAVEVTLGDRPASTPVTEQPRRAPGFDFPFPFGR